MINRKILTYGRKPLSNQQNILDSSEDNKNVLSKLIRVCSAI